MNRATHALTLVLAVAGCGEAPVPYVYCDEDTMFPAITESINAGGLADIDATEVTQGQYQIFLNETGGGTDVTGQPSYCAWNTTYAVQPECHLTRLSDDRMLGDVLTCDSLPQTCVDWCDAYMYCEWAGKHLCGSSRDGSRIPLEQATTLESEWNIGCTAGGQNTYGAGTSDDTRSRCNTLSCFSEMSCGFPVDLVARTGTLVAPGSMPDCQPPQSPYAGIYDMTGNVWEWENACDGETGEEDECASRGSSYSTSPTPCDFAVPRPRSNASSLVGFRCCGDPADP